MENVIIGGSCRFAGPGPCRHGRFMWLKTVAINVCNLHKSVIGGLYWSRLTVSSPESTEMGKKTSRGKRYPGQSFTIALGKVRVGHCKWRCVI